MIRKFSIVKGLFLFSICLFLSCDDEKTAGPGDNDTYVKLFASSLSVEPVDMVVEADASAVILATVTEEIETNDFGYRMRVIRTDEFGNEVWQASYPAGDFEEFVENPISRGFQASSITPFGEGYLLVGQEITVVDVQNEITETRLAVIEIDGTGNELVSNIITLDDGFTPIEGIDVAVNSVGEIRVVGLINDDEEEEPVWLGSFDSSLNLISECTFTYSAAGELPLITQGVFVDSGDDIILATNALVGIGINSRIIRVPTCQPTQISGPLISDSETTDFEVNQMSRSLNGYAMVGTTNIELNNDIFLARLDPFGVLIDAAPIVYNTIGEQTLTTDERGLAITATPDGGFLIGGSTLFSVGENDILLIKTDFNGNVLWTKFYGDQNEDRPVTLSPAPGGGFMILAVTEFGGINTPLLIKTDNQGDVN